MKPNNQPSSRVKQFVELFSTADVVTINGLRVHCSLVQMFQAKGEPENIVMQLPGPEGVEKITEGMIHDSYVQNNGAINVQISEGEALVITALKYAVCAPDASAWESTP